MSKIFISHSAKDTAAALAVGAWLTEHGWSDFFLDASADRGLAPGERWQEALKRAADRCEAVLFLVSDNWLQSRWCLAEFLLAKQLGKKIFGVLIKPTPLEALPPEMRGEWQLCDLTAGSERERITVQHETLPGPTEVFFGVAGLTRLRIGLQRAGLDASTFPWPPPNDPGRPPYAGLRALDREDAAVFFGRDAPMLLALDTLRRLRESSGEQLFVILGASGAGKSSFLRAGVLPRLARDDRNFLVLPVIRPERLPISGPHGLVASLDGLSRALGRPTSRADIRRAVQDSDALLRLFDELRSFAAGRLGDSADGPPPALVCAIDQAEELFGVEEPGETNRMLDIIADALRRRADAAGRAPDVFFLAAIRSDSYERLQTHPRLDHVKQHLFGLQPIPRDEYKSVIEGPAARHRDAGNQLNVEPRLTARLLQDTQGADALPLLAFTLERLFIEHGGDGVLSLDDYADLGGVEGSITAAVAAAFADPLRDPQIPADEAERNRRLREGFLPWLAGVDPDTEAHTRRVATWDEIPAGSRPLLERLIAQRLLVRDRRSVPGVGDSVVVEVAHEALLRRWPMLSLWLDQDADALKAVDAARRAASEWVRNGRRDAWLNHTKERLAAVESLLQRPDLDRLLGEDGRVYLRACRRRDEEAAGRVAAAERERAENERRILEAEQHAERERLRNAEAEAQQAHERVAAAQRLSRRTMLGAAIAVVLMFVAAGFAWSNIRQRRAAEHALGTLSVAEARRLSTAGLVPQSIAHLARAVRLDPNDAVWRASLVSALLANRWARPLLDVPTADPARVSAFSPDGTLLLVGAGDEARLWNIREGSPVGHRMRHKNTVTAAAFNPDGSLIVTAAMDRTIRVWNGRTGEPSGDVISENSSRADRVAFSATGKLIIAWTAGEARVYDTATRRQFADGKSSVLAASPLGRFALIRQGDIVRLRRLETGEAVGPEMPGFSRLDSVDFTPDESVAAIVGNGSVYVFGTSPGALSTRLGNAAGSEVSLSADGRRLIAWGGSQNAFVIDPTLTSLNVPLNANDYLTGGRLVAGGTRAITMSGESSRRRQVQVWNADTGSALPGWRTARFSDIATCGTGSAALSLRGSTVQVWDLAADRPIGSPIVHAAVVDSVRFSRDCRVAATIARNEVRVLDVATGALRAQPLVHGGTVNEASFAPDGAQIAVVSASQATVWDLRAAAAGPEPMRHGEPGDAVAFGPDGAYVATVAPDGVRVWDASSGAPVGAPVLTTEPLERVEIGPGGKRLLIVSQRAGLRFVDAAGGRARETAWSSGDLSSGASQFAISPDWTTIVRVVEKAGRIWTIQTKERRGKLLTHRNQITSVAFSPDGTRVATTSQDQTARVWSARTGEPVGVPMRHERSVSRAIFSADGSRVATVADKVMNDRGFPVWFPRDVRVWNAATGQPVGPTIEHDDNVTAVALRPDGGRVVTAAGSSVRLRDSGTGAPVGDQHLFPEEVRAVTFSPDGTRILVVAGGEVTVWDAAQFTRIADPLVAPREIANAAFLPDGQRLMIVTAPARSELPDRPCPRCAPEGYVWDVPTGDAGGAPILADVSEWLAGYRVTDLGAIEALPNRRDARAALLQAVASSRTEAATQRLASWLMADPTSRAASPFSGQGRGAAATRVASVSAAGSKD